jgi:hypothetical protein
MTRARGALIKAAAAAVLVPAAAFAIGVSVAHSLLIAGAAIAAVAALELASAADPPYWPDPVESARGGNRREIARLSWTLRAQRSEAGSAAVLRLRDIARHRLAAAGIDLDDAKDQPAAAARLGGPVHRILTAQSGRPPSRREIALCIQALEQLPAVRDAPHAGPATI